MGWPRYESGDWRLDVKIGSHNETKFSLLRPLHSRRENFDLPINRKTNVKTRVSNSGIVFF